ncbi:prenyltransferase/squalene oxidase repeat-containing protein [Archangium lipolyticum]|uniref:prenyltransferase/squalene oxidase repeat-containing protein n=1 Tax=Archangium lipolyticum TaxID=2970465 RepID=UPI00214A55D9|nr:prenyltransferase/squalene oxidase repeat-containing protein [Archangium lipolyticum]
MNHDEKVLSFLEKRLTRNGLFVEVGESAPTVESIRFGLDTMASIDKEVDESVRRSSAAYLLECLLPDGGFAISARSTQSKLSSTYYAVRLFELKRVDGGLPDRHRTSEWIIGQLFDGAGIAESVNVDELYYAARALQLMAAPELDHSRIDTVVRYIKRCCSPAGGFGLSPGAPADIERTYCCLHMLQTLGHLHDPEKHAKWVSSCIIGGQVYWDPSGAKVSPATFYWGLRAASIAGAEVAWSDVASAIRNFEKEDGGYGDEAGSQL